MDGNMDNFDVSLDAPGPYGFRLTGGLGTSMPLRIGKVQNGSKAGNAGLQVGHQVLKIDNHLTRSMTHKEAKKIIKTCQEALHLTIQGQQKFVLLQPPLPPGLRSLDDRPPARIPHDSYLDEADSGLSLTSTTSSVTDLQSDVQSDHTPDPMTTDPTANHSPFPEFDPVQLPSYYESEPPPIPGPPPPPPPPPFDHGDDRREMPELVRMTSIESENSKEDAILSGMRCGACSKDVKARDMFVKLDGISWHVECLNCMECRLPLFNKKYNVRHGMPICPHHL